jgi:hypothetical protein
MCSLFGEDVKTVSKKVSRKNKKTISSVSEKPQTQVAAKSKH